MTILVNHGIQLESEYGIGSISVTDNGKLIRLSKINIPSPTLPVPLIQSVLDYSSINNREPYVRITDISFEGVQTYIMTDSAVFDLFFNKENVDQIIDDVTKSVKVYTARALTDSVKSFISFYKIFSDDPDVDYDEQYVVNGCILRLITINFNISTSFLPQAEINFNGLTLKKLTDLQKIDYDPESLSDNITDVNSLDFFDWDVNGEDVFELTELIRDITISMNIGLTAQEKDNLSVSTQRLYDGNYDYSIVLSVIRAHTNVLMDYVLNFNKSTIPIDIEFRITQGDKFQRWLIDGLIPESITQDNSITTSQIDSYAFKFRSIQVDVFDNVTDLERSV